MQLKLSEERELVRDKNAKTVNDNSQKRALGDTKDPARPKEALS
jgi:hypothetical protein